MTSRPDPWGPTTIPLRQARIWQLGPLHLHVARAPWEWSFSWWRDGALLDDHLRLAEVAEVRPASRPDVESKRFAFGETADPLTLLPALGDRVFVATPEVPFYVLPAESVRAYVSVPLWVQARVGRDARLALEVPVLRPQDTWFGSPTAGTLCYASRTAMRLELDAFVPLAHRALVTVEVVNRGDTSLTVQRLRLPVPELGLFRDPSGQLRTPAVRFTRERDELAVVELGAVPSEWTLLADARARPSGTQSVVQAFNAFFSRGQ